MDEKYFIEGVPSVNAGLFRAVLNEHGYIILISEDDGYKISIDSRSEPYRYLRRRIVENGLSPKIVINNPVETEWVETSGRRIEASLMVGNQSMISLDDEIMKMPGIWIPSLDSLMYWMNTNDISQDIKDFVIRNYDDVKNDAPSLKLDDEGFSIFLKRWLWGGSDFVKRYSRGDLVKRDAFNIDIANALLNSNWRVDAVVDGTELSYIKKIYDHALDWNFVTVSEFAYLIAHMRDLLPSWYHDQGSHVLKRSKKNIDYIKRQRSSRIKLFRKAKEEHSALLWFGYAVKLLSSKHNINKNDFTKPGYWVTLLERIAEVAMKVNLDDAKPYLEVGILDVNVIVNSLKNDIDPELALIMDKS